MSHDEIARGLAISRVTLLKYFDAELTTGWSQKRLEVLTAMFTAAKKGNVSAQRAFIALQPRVMPQPPAPAKAAPLGKKEQASVDAVAALNDEGWGDLLQPPPALQ